MTRLATPLPGLLRARTAPRRVVVPRALPPSYFAALLVLLAGFTLAVSRPVLDPRVLWLYVGALILVLHATTVLLYDEPRYAWTYKHLGVINAIAAHGTVDRTLDIYSNWSGFFALGAWLKATRLSPVFPSAVMPRGTPSGFFSG